MAKLRLGQVDYINYMPVYHALEEGQLPLDAEIFKASPVKLKEMLLNDQLDITPLSSIEYARYADKCYILPNMSVSTDDRTASVFLFSRMPVTELEAKKVVITGTETTCVALLKILLEHYYHVEVEYLTMNIDLEGALTVADAVLLIGEQAMVANQQVKDDELPYIVTDLGTAWKEFTGQKMVFAVWAIRENFAKSNGEQITNTAEILYRSKLLGIKQMPTLVDKARHKCRLAQEALEEYFQLIDYEFDNQCRQALITFYDYAYKSGLIEERVKLNIWDENILK